jgi:hypothetical protein
MVSITLSVPPEVKQEMERFPEMNWSGFVRKAIIEKTEELTLHQELLRRLKEERPIVKWAVKAQRAWRKGRMDELKKLL